MSVDLVAPSMDDTARITAVINRSEQFDGVPRVLEEAELREELAGASVNLERDVRMAIVDGELAGYTMIQHEPSGVDHERASVFGTVDPEQRGKGVGRELLRWSIEAATARLRSIDNDLPKFVRSYQYEQITDFFSLAARFGFQPVRWFDELLMPLSERPAATNPTDIDIVPWSAFSNDDHLRVRNASFADHWGSLPVTSELWNTIVSGYGSRLDLSCGAVDTVTGELVGTCWNKNYPADEELLGRRDGWIQILGTLREHRGRGVASALIAHSLRSFELAGLTHAAIGVDSDNPSGASRLYRSIGFQPQHREVVSQIEVSDALQ